MELRELREQVGKFALVYPYGKSEQSFLCIIQCFIEFHPLSTMRPVMYFLRRGDSLCYGGQYKIIPYEEVRHELVGVVAVYQGFGCGQVVSETYDLESRRLKVKLRRLSDGVLSDFVSIEDVVIVCG